MRNGMLVQLFQLKTQIKCIRCECDFHRNENTANLSSGLLWQNKFLTFECFSFRLHAYADNVRGKHQQNNTKAPNTELGGIIWLQPNPIFITLLYHVCVCMYVWALVKKHKTNEQATVLLRKKYIHSTNKHIWEVTYHYSYQNLYRISKHNKVHGMSDPVHSHQSRVFRVACFFPSEVCLCGGTVRVGCCVTKAPFAGEFASQITCIPITWKMLHLFWVALAPRIGFAAQVNMPVILGKSISEMRTKRDGETGEYTQ